MESEARNIIIIGPQGSGKSSQAQLLAEKLSLPHISTGEICRKIAAQDSAFGKKISQIMVSGALVGDEDMFLIIEKSVPKRGFVAEGFPRTLYQAQNLPLEIDKVVYIKVPDAECEKRILKGTMIGGKGVDRGKRADDTPEIVAKRLALFHQETEPVLEYFRQKGLLVEVDGMGSIDDVFARILRSIL